MRVAERPTIKDVAERAGVSIATVSRALNDKGDVSGETRERVREVARAVGYTPDPAARALAGQKTRLIAIVVGDNAGHRDLSLIFFGKVLTAISRRLSQSGYDPLLLQPGDIGLDHGFDAAILIGVDGDDPLVEELATRQVPLVGVDVRCKSGRAAYVGSDHADGVRLALAHLHARGHRRIAHLAGATNTFAASERLAAFRRETAALRLDIPDELIRQGDFSSASGYRETCALLALRERPTAIVAASDLMALAALQAIRDAGLQPGTRHRRRRLRRPGGSRARASPVDDDPPGSPGAGGARGDPSRRTDRRSRGDSGGRDPACGARRARLLGLTRVGG